MSFYEGIAHIKHPAPITDATWNYWVLGLSLAFEGISFFLAFREFNKSRGEAGFWATLGRSKDPSVFAILMEDSAALLGLVIALAGVYFGHMFQNPYFDGAASICIGVLLISVAVFLIYKTKGLLVGEGVEEQTLDALEALVRQQAGVEQTRRPLTMYLGPQDVILALDVDFYDHLSAVEVEKTVDELQDKIRATYPEFKRIFIEAHGLAGQQRTPLPPGPTSA
ncbi:cation diffusion facilitator family transporter [Hymenobacter sp. 5516J-16]|uniref:cation diffusion facilitator family transporter n=1 Tax=Hymenobacter sp. 5516J-16 TaxID=2932253 RepID=UPI0021D41102|nr:cation transporter [Hymenobacter sp. 5516J-16]